MTDQSANEIYDLLIAEGGASPQERIGFVHHAINAHPLSFEWRFRGVLGFGGKFRFGDRHGKQRIYVDCYPEDLTPKRQQTIDIINSKLAIYASEKASRSTQIRDSM